MTVKRKIQVTKNYHLFKRHEGENRALDMKKHRKLMESMKLYGFLPCYPIIVVRDKNGDLIVKDGQHRLTIAESLGLPVYWVEEVINFDVAVVNSAQKPWQTKDYALKWAASGKKDYQDGIDFSEQHGLPIGLAFALLSGVCSFSPIEDHYKLGEFKVKDREWANAVAGVWGPLTAMSPSIKSARLLEAIMACCRVPEFDGKRLLDSAARCREKLVSYSTKDAYLDMLEDVYNYGRKQLLGLKAAATMAMRERSFGNIRPPGKRKAS